MHFIIPVALEKRLNVWYNKVESKLFKAKTKVI